MTGFRDDLNMRLRMALARASRSDRCAPGICRFATPGLAAFIGLLLNAAMHAAVHAAAALDPSRDTVYRTQALDRPLSESAPERLRLAAVNASPQMRRALARAMQNVLLEDDAAKADLIWDAGDKTVADASGISVAYGIEASSLQGVVDKWQALKALQAMRQATPLDIIVKPHDGMHREGDRLLIATEALRHPFVSVIGLAPDGEVKWLFPHETDTPQWTVGQPFSLADDAGPIIVTPPFGADHLVIIASDRPLDSLKNRLKGSGAAPLPQLLGEAVRGMGFQLGVKAIYTQARPQR